MKKEFVSKMNEIMDKRNLSEDFVEEFKDWGGQIVLYGCGHAAQYYVKYLRKRGVEITAIADKVRKTPLFDIPVKPIEDIISQYKIENIIWVISAPSLRKEIRQMLLQYTSENKIYDFEVELYEYYNTNSQKYRLFLKQNINILADIYADFADDFSRETMLKVIEGRLTGNLDAVSDIWMGDQYWPEGIIHFTEQESIIECGSSDGNTLRELYAELKGKYKHIYCFEPDKGCEQILKRTIHELDSDGNISFIPKGTYRESATLYFENEEIESGLSKVTECGDTSIECDAIDDEKCGEVKYIKMDIEGAELDTLIGAKRTIIENRPKLAVCIYHKDEDIVTIVRYLQELNLGYQFYIRHHNCNMTETVLYAL